MLYLCKFVIFRIKLRGNLLACRSLSPWHASLPPASNVYGHDWEMDKVHAYACKL